MRRIPFGIRRLDTTIGGGAPAGSLVLLSGEAGAGAREFAYTSAAMNALQAVDEDLFDLYYGEVTEGTQPAPNIHYISFTAEGPRLRREMEFVLDEEITDAATENITFHDLSTEYFRISPVPRDWYSNRTASITSLGGDEDRSTVPEALGDVLSDHATENLVVIDSLTDLISAAGEDMSWADIPKLLKGITRAAYEWGGLVLVLLNHETLSTERHGQLVDAADGSFLFEWESGGSTRARTLVVRQFRGILSAIEDEDIVQFETEIGDAGFDISDVRKIR
ncbi:RAD55 family ATPase [Halosegnis longus]|uniref:HTR-like protein n=1 Tax=Halosegnis longus TaxID=2216012 RepID=A0AAJ4R9H1_9EURY|nr:HTR-like protein [Halosegnis longus]RNJ26612.1 HTR-like protein [Salella cibi]